MPWDCKQQAPNPTWGEGERASWRKGCLRQSEGLGAVPLTKIKKEHFRERGGMHEGPGEWNMVVSGEKPVQKWL